MVLKVYRFKGGSVQLVKTSGGCVVEYYFKKKRVFMFNVNDNEVENTWDVVVKEIDNVIENALKEYFK